VAKQLPSYVMLHEYVPGLCKLYVFGPFGMDNIPGYTRVPEYRYHLKLSFVRPEWSGECWITNGCHTIMYADFAAQLFGRRVYRIRNQHHILVLRLSKNRVRYSKLLGKKAARSSILIQQRSQ
jgi:hypothetical protein